MPDLTSIISVISTVGFPIAACCYIYYADNKAMTEEREAHKAESEKFAEAINNNTLIMTKLYEKLGGNEEK